MATCLNSSGNISEENNFETSTEISRILKILTDTIKNTEIVLCLPSLLANDGAILKDYITEDETNFITNTCKKVSQDVGEELSRIEPGTLLRTDMCLIIDLLLSKSDLCDFCRSISSDTISPGGITLLRNLEELRICVSEQLKVTPNMKAQQDIEHRRLFQQSERNKEELKKLSDKFNKLSTETEQEIKEKTALIKKQMEKISVVKRQCRDKVKKKMEEAEKQINWDIKNSEYHIDELQAEAKNSQYRREIQLKEHLNTERDLRAKRYKIESQLVAMVQKYDSDMGERQAMLEELTITYEEEKEQMATLQEKFDIQEIDYISLMFEKEQYEKQQWEAQLYEIQCRIATRKIQRYFRAYLATKTKGKKGKKGKKKK